MIGFRMRFVGKDVTSISTGSHLGRYQVHDLIARGGMGEVYRAHDAHSAHDLAFSFELVLRSLAADERARACRPPCGRLATLVRRFRRSSSSGSGRDRSDYEPLATNRSTADQYAAASAGVASL
jgi:serine/threonine protein kinase